MLQELDFPVQGGKETSQMEATGTVGPRGEAQAVWRLRTRQSDLVMLCDVGLPTS